MVCISNIASYIEMYGIYYDVVIILQQSWVCLAGEVSGVSFPPGHQL